MCFLLEVVLVDCSFTLVYAIAFSFFCKYFIVVLIIDIFTLALGHSYLEKRVSAVGFCCLANGFQCIKS